MTDATDRTNMYQRSVHIQTIQSAGGDHLTEDASYAGLYEHQVVMVVADGAPQRLQPVASMQPLLARFAPRFGAEVTPSGIASRLVCATVAECLAREPSFPLGEAIRQANQRLGDALRDIYGDLEAETLLRHEPAFTILAEDARYRRLLLPACTYTAVRINLSEQTFEVAHGADSALFVFWEDGSVEQVTPDQMRPHDDAFRQLWLETGDQPAEHPFFRALGDNAARELNRRNGLFHNYVDAQGQPDPAVGVSVVNGLPEIEHYMFQVRRPLAGARALLVTSDGVFWPAPPDETAEATHNRLHTMRQRIEQDGLAGYIAALRAEEQRLMASGVPYTHDDATAVFTQL